jgi:hypothetical protein
MTGPALQAANGRFRHAGRAVRDQRGVGVMALRFGRDGDGMSSNRVGFGLRPGPRFCDGAFTRLSFRLVNISEIFFGGRRR